jgi:predicted DNA repair protein MutK
VSVGLIALLDDIAAIAKVAAATIDDVAGQAAKASAKAAGVVIDDAAVTPRYVVGFAASREVPIVAKIARGSLRNKLLILLPAAMGLSYFLPSAIMPLLMIGGVYLCYEGTEKVFETLLPHHAHAHEAGVASVALNPQTVEDEKVAGAIKTDFILSAEIMAIALASIPDSNFWTQGFVLIVVAVGITAGVYGVVALIVKADDLGVALAKNRSSSPWGTLSRAFGYALVTGMPILLIFLSIVGTAAMIWVGGGIIVHGMETYGLTAIGHAIHDAAEVSAHVLMPIAGMVEWLVTAIGFGIVGLAIGAIAIPLMGFVIGPTWKALKGVLRCHQTA